MQQPSPPRLSVVIPVFDEQDNVEPMCERLAEHLPQDVAWEVIFVDDGSRDETFSRLRAIASHEPRIRIVRFRRNYGQTPAMVAGIEHARGDVILTMDGDLQNDPSDIPRFLEAIDQGYDIVVGWRERRQDALITRKIPSKIANWIIGKVTGIAIRDNGCSLKAYRAALIRNIPLYSEMHRFIPAVASIAGSQILELPVKHHPRVHGASKYGLKRIYKVLFDLVVIRTLLSTLGNPLRFFGKVAIVPFMMGAWMIAYATLDALRGAPNMIILGTGLLWSAFGLFSVCWGMLAELLHRTADRKEFHLASLKLEVTK
jgi:glycosyltransferase involved in cell wall biosynthesis